jgi:uncharacterized OB-fold protein
MRIKYHPALKHLKQGRWASVHLATGKFKPSDWTTKDQKVIRSLLPEDLKTLNQKGVTKILDQLYATNVQTWKKFNWFARVCNADMPSAFKNAAESKFCAFCGQVFPRKDVCNACYSSDDQAVALSRELSAKRISQGWHKNNPDEKAKKGDKIRATRASWSQARKEEVRRTLVAASASVDKAQRLRKMEATNRRRYGVRNVSQSAEVQKNKRDHQLAKYGVAHHSQRPEIAEKMSRAWDQKTVQFYTERAAQSAATYKKRTGYTHNMRNPDLMEARIQKSLIDWGVENPASSPEVRDKINDTWESRYGYREIFASPEVRAKIRRTLIQRYGVENPMGHAPFIRQIQEQRKNPVRYKGETYYVDSSLEADCLVRLKDRYEEVYTQYDDRYPALLTWLPDFYLPAFDRYVEVKGVYTLLHANDGRALIRNREKANDDCEWMVKEAGHWTHLPKGWEDLKFTALSRYIAEKTHKPKDFVSDVCAKVFAKVDHHVEGNYIHCQSFSVFCANLVEHNSDVVGPRFVAEAQARYPNCVVVWDYEWNSSRTAVKKYLSSKLGSKFVVGARSTEVSMSKLNDADTKFFQVNHLQGPPRRGVCVRLSYRGRVVAAMVFTSVQSVRGSVADPDVYELIRFATVGRVIGAASKLMSAFVKKYSPTRIISYSDAQHFDGRVYEVLGFRRVSRSKPDYRTVWSFVDYTTMSKQASKRSNLAKIEGFDADLSESQNLKLLGIPKIYDCGKVKWEWFGGAGQP